MKRKLEKPIVKVIELEAMDVITTSVNEAPNPKGVGFKGLTNSTGTLINNYTKTSPTSGAKSISSFNGDNYYE